MECATADLWDEHGEQLESLPIQFADYGGRTRFSGRVRTLKCHEDNALLIGVLSTASEGEVLVVDGGGSLRAALIGDMYADLAAQNGWSGVIIHGAVRDSAALHGIPLGIKALGTNPRRSSKTGSGEENVELQLGSVKVIPGAMIYCDEDGVLLRRDL